jgi:phenylalanyl-tRNA synthetase beta chain
MKLPLSWLQEWVRLPPAWDAAEVARRLTQAGFEIEAVSTAAPAFHGVVVAKILSAERLAQSDKLQLCRVSTGSSAGEAPLQIVCGAPNARAGLVSALATVGALLPDGVEIRAAHKRGANSQGMLCSSKELGMAEQSEGILELPDDAPLGVDLRTYLDLDDAILDITVTPNRGDAMSVLGIARELSALSGAPLLTPQRVSAATLAQVAAAPAAGPSPADAAQPPDTIALQVRRGAGAPRLLARVLRAVDNTLASPLWLRERLRRAGLRSITAVVDVTNFVMLELGQPMHAFDLAKLRGGLMARRAGEGEGVQLLDGRELELESDVLVIADDSSAVGLAGVMGGARTAISTQTRDIALEAAWFKPEVIAGRARRYGLQTDASQRFERGVDWRGQERALGLATQLIVQMLGGTAGPLCKAELPDELPPVSTVELRSHRLQRLLGASVPGTQVEQRLRALGMTVRAQGGDWQVQPPSWRFDVAIEADLIEEVVRLGGLDTIEEQAAPMRIVPRALQSNQVDEQVVMRTLAARGFQEIITFGFVDPALQRLLFGEQPAIELANPIAADLAVMRSSLWPGLISVARENLRRQQPRVRLFEIATRFLLEGARHREQKMLAGLVLGSRLPEQWGTVATPVDFFDLKGELQNLLALGGVGTECAFEPLSMGCLYPGRSARIVRQGIELGVIGELHPALVRSLDLTYAPIVFEVDFDGAFRANLAQFREVSRFPQIRRDISFTLPADVAFARLRERVSVAAGSLLKKLSAFDIYQGDGVESGRKSIALGLILQDLNRTLTDEDADRVVKSVLDDLQSNLDARIRE